MKVILILFFSLNLAFGNQSYCSNKKDYEMYLFTFKEHENKLISLKKSKDKEKLFLETFQANYYGLLYNECLAKVKEKELNRLISSKI